MISIKSASWAYQAAEMPSLHAIDLEIKRGEMVVLCGASGSGKSTLLRMMNGLVPHFHEGTLEGEATVDGLDVRTSSLDELGQKTGTVLQHPRRQFFTSTVIDELSFALENFGEDPDRIQTRVDAMMQQFGLTNLANQSLLTLSGGQQQRVAVASALGHDPGFLLLDEPSSNLSADAVSSLASILAELRRAGIGIVVSEHRLHYLVGVADRFVLLQDGRIYKEWDAEAFAALPNAVLAEYGLRSSTLPAPNVLPHIEAAGPSVMVAGKRTTSQADGLQLTNVRCTIGGQTLVDVESARFPAGKVTAICGLNGVGKTTLTRAIAGLQQHAGDIKLNGRRLGRRERLTITAIVMQDVQRQLFTESARAEIELVGNHSPTQIDELLHDFDLLPFADQHPLALSGGQQQRLVIAATKQSRAKVVIYDEPSSGVDRRHLDSIAAAIRASAEDGAVVLLVTHDDDLLRRAADARLELRLHPSFSRRPANMTTSSATPTPQASSSPAKIDLFAPVRAKIVLIAVLNLLAGVATVVPFVSVVELARVLVPALDGNPIDANQAWLIVAVASVSLLLRFALLMGAGLVSHLADNDLQLEIRKNLIGHLRRLPLGWFDSSASGGVKKVVENDVDALHQLVAHSIQDLVLAVTLPVVSLVYMFAIDWRMALAALLPLVLVFVVLPVMLRGHQERLVEYDASLGRMTNAVIEFIHGIVVVKSFGQTGRSHQRYRDETGAFTRFYGDWMRSSSIPQTLVDLITAPVVILVYLTGVGALLVTSGSLAPIDLLPSLLLGLGIAAPYLALGYTSQYLREAFNARDSVVSLLGAETMAYSDAPEQADGNHVELDQLRFSYDGERDVLTDIVAHCIPGTVTALVGPSGSGKSTLARLVPRFYDVTGGSLRIGEHDVRQLSAETLYGRVGFVFQDPYLLRTTIRDNIRLARPEASDSDVERVARAAQIHDRIVALPDGYDTVIGDGASLSGGEQQRVAIARGLLTDAPILVLDEATSFADPDSEAASSGRCRCWRPTVRSS